MAELKWLEDLQALMEEDSFTKAAQKRFVTQPAFSRRIRLLEAWLDVELVDRRRKPISISPLAREHEFRIRELISNFYQLRNDLQNRNRHQRTSFVVQHTLAVSRFPSLIQQIQPALPNKAYHLNTTNNEECAALFSEEISFMLCYQLPGHPLLTEARGIRHKMLGTDRMIPVAQQALFNSTLKQTITEEISGQPLPLLMFPRGGFLAEVLATTCLPNTLRKYSIDTICESAFAISLKEMVLAGMGIAWLPGELVATELESGALTSLEPWLGSCQLDICLYYRNGGNADKAFRLIPDSQATPI